MNLYCKVENNLITQRVDMDRPRNQKIELLNPRGDEVVERIDYPATELLNRPVIEQEAEGWFPFTFTKVEPGWHQKQGSESIDVNAKTITETVIDLDATALKEKTDNYKKNKKHNVDVTAANIRNKYAGYSLINEEYQLAYNQAITFKEALYDEKNTPPCVQAWLDNSVFKTAKEAADNIIATGDGYYQILETIRVIRLKAKFSIDNVAEDAKSKDSIDAIFNNIDWQGLDL